MVTTMGGTQLTDTELAEAMPPFAPRSLGLTDPAVVRERGGRVERALHIGPDPGVC